MTADIPFLAHAPHNGYLASLARKRSHVIKSDLLLSRSVKSQDTDTTVSSLKTDKDKEHDNSRIGLSNEGHEARLQGHASGVQGQPEGSRPRVGVTEVLRFLNRQFPHKVWAFFPSQLKIIIRRR